MALDVDVPPPPTLRDPRDPGEYESVGETDEAGDDYRREELATFLREGAWEDAFAEWAEHTYLTEGEFQAVLDADLIDGIDLYWDPAAGEVGYRTPELPEGAGLDGIDTEALAEEIDALARVVSDLLETEYVGREGDEFGFFADR